MTQTDRDRWNRRYAEGAYASRKHPSALLVEWLPRLAVGPGQPVAIDVACGLGRNAIYLARRGWRVVAVDVSEVALGRLRELAMAEGLAITCIQADLEAGWLQPDQRVGAGPYDLALVIRYTNLPLIAGLPGALKPGGYLIVEAHLLTDAEVVGPREPEFRVAPGELRQAAEGLEILHYREALVTDPDRRQAALARLVARRP